MQMCDKVKQFLALDWRKNILLIALLIYSTYVHRIHAKSIYPTGFPFSYYEYGVMSHNSEFIFLSFILDILIFYIISCILIYFSDKIIKYKIRFRLLDYLTIVFVVITITWIFVKYAIGSFWAIV